MIYLSRMLGKPVVDATGEEIGTINDIAIATGEVFPRVTSLAFIGPGQDAVHAVVAQVRRRASTTSASRSTSPRADLRFSYLQPDEVLLAPRPAQQADRRHAGHEGRARQRPQALRVAQPAAPARRRGRRPRHPARHLAGARARRRRASRASSAASCPRTSSRGTTWTCSTATCRHVKLSVTHKRLHELHPADVADILEQLSPAQRAQRLRAPRQRRRPPRRSPSSRTSCRPTSSTTSPSQRASDILERWTRTTPPTSSATCPTTRPRRCCA